MHAEVVVREVALHFHLEAVDVGVVGNELVCRVSLSVYVRCDQRWTVCNSQLIASVEPLAAPAFDKSRRKQRSFRPRPSAWGFAGRPYSEGVIGPRRTVMFLKGPLVTQPDPLPGGMTKLGMSFDGIPVPLCGMYSPSPLIEVALPSKSGEPTMSWAYFPQLM